MLDVINAIFSGFILIKIGFLVLSGFYTAFLFIVYNQARAMQKVINDDGASSLVNTVALFNIIVGLTLFVAALIIL